MKITLETATFIDSLRKAEAIAPRKGAVADTSYGIILECDADASSLTSKATDGVFFYSESIPILEIEGTGQAVWRVPSASFYGSVSKLPTKIGSQVVLADEGNLVTVKSGRTVIKVPMMKNENYPEFDFYDASEFTEFTNISGKSTKLKWATSSLTSDPKHCVYVRGDKMYATDRYRAARIELSSDMGISALYPPLTLGRVVPFGADVKISKQGTLLVISPDDYSQLCMSTMDDSDFPWQAIDKMMESEFEYSSAVPKSEFLRMLDGAAPLVGKKDVAAPIHLYIGSGEVAVYFQSEDGIFGDRIPAEGDCEEHKRIKFGVTLSFLRTAVDSLSDLVVIEYSEFKKIMRFNDGTYKAAIALRGLDE